MVPDHVRSAPMDYGASGVWDSPMATDYWVKRFGWMWAGGRSGMYGLKALQVKANCEHYFNTPFRLICNINNS